MNTKLLIGVVILFSISVIVRIAPAFVKNRLNSETLDNIEQVLPICVFIPMAVYFFITEIQKNFLPAIISFIFIFILLQIKSNNLVTIIGSILLFIFIKNFTNLS
ncbi:AzlD domain-containing protein [Acinetobacter seifertii]|uniref:AzlD domain-containing protein n=1 Tax=Acinetobacter seifertii TaxID=1530123 RepID=UPI000D346949|nr:AzlD domain-containing protein [Acinetobacter seifertii]PTV47838.1 hypothetical protein DBL04_18245 [Acinetobacter seifertii]